MTKRIQLQHVNRIIAVRCAGTFPRRRTCHRTVYFDPKRKLGERHAIRCEQCLRVFCRPCARRHFLVEEEMISRAVKRGLNARDRADIKRIASKGRAILRKLRKDGWFSA